MENIMLEFESLINIDGEIESNKFKSSATIERGRANKICFKKGNDKYELFFNQINAKVKMNNSIYDFSTIKDTKGLTKIDKMTLESVIHTNKLEFDNKVLKIEYTMDFKTFKGIYNIKISLID